MRTKPPIGLVVTSIQPPNRIMRNLAAMAVAVESPFLVLGDRKSPANYELPGARFLSIDQQHDRFGDFSKALPENHYVRKNLGYLAVLETGATWVLETDDDNDPLAAFLTPPEDSIRVRLPKPNGFWVNAYAYFDPTDPVWPRGMPLEVLHSENLVPPVTGEEAIVPRLVQGLADDNPDVDAVFRLTRRLPVRFAARAALALNEGQWCPFNSQNTWFHRDIAPLLYLPTYCSFRMTDIWRSFVAQRCLWAMGHKLIFIAPTVRQERNEHNLLKDFADEVPGYLNNERIRQVLDRVDLSGKPEQDLYRCYEALVKAELISREELTLVQSWLDALQSALRPAHS